MNIAEIPVADLIPQRPPFVMVDRLESCGMTDAVTTFLIRDENIFCDNNQLSQAGMLENMAQSCSARMGWLGLTHGGCVKIGMIGEIRDCRFIRQPKVGEQITTYVHIIQEVFNLTMATATMTVDGETAASTTIVIAIVAPPRGRRARNDDDAKSYKTV